MSTLTAALPLIIRGEVLEPELKDFGSVRAPDPTPYLDRLVLADPLALRDVHELRLGEIVDYLVELGERLDYESNPHVREAVEFSGEGPLYTREIVEGIYRGLPQMLRREVLEEYIEHNIGAEFLEGWVDAELHDRRIAVRAFGARTVHVIAGNSPIIALQTVIANAISRGDAIVKVPANDPYAAPAIARTMIEMAPDHPLTRHLSVAYWKGGDEAIESRLYDPRNLEKIVAWGGFTSMRSIRRYLGPGLDLVALDPKLSASIIGRQAFQSDQAFSEAAEGAAADIGYFNQGGCVSARVLYVETGTDEAGIERANRLGAEVMERVRRLPADLSSPHPAFDPELREELAGIRHAPDFRVFGGQGDEGAVIVSQDEEIVDFSELLDCRVANIVPIDRADDALKYLTIHTQTIGIYPDELKLHLRDECAMRGAQRIVSLGSATSAGMAGPHDAIQVLSRMVRWIRDDTL
jgi:Acyl-CoA reductase (LuxC)